MAVFQIPTPNPRLWRHRSQNISIGVGKILQLANQGTVIPEAYIFPDRGNSTFVVIGTRSILTQGLTTPTSCVAQLDPGRGASIWVDDPDREQFDLGDWWVTHNAAVAQIICVTVYQRA